MGVETVGRITACRGYPCLSTPDPLAHFDFTGWPPVDKGKQLSTVSGLIPRPTGESTLGEGPQAWGVGVIAGGPGFAYGLPIVNSPMRRNLGKDRIFVFCGITSRKKWCNPECNQELGSSQVSFLTSLTLASSGLQIRHSSVRIRPAPL